MCISLADKKLKPLFLTFFRDFLFGFPNPYENRFKTQICIVYTLMKYTIWMQFPIENVYVTRRFSKIINISLW